MRKLSARISLFSIASLLCLSFMTADLVHAKDRMDEGRPEIQLTAEQKEKAKAIMEQYRANTQADREALKTKNEELRSLMDSPNPDRSKVEALCSEIGALQGKRLLNRFDLRQELVKEGLPPQLADRKGDKGSRGGKAGKGERRGDRKNKKGEGRD